MLRGYAALLVAAFHLHAAALNEGNDKSLWNFFSSGGIGVDIFFVISGFIILKSAQQRHYWTSTTFLLRRALRIFPLYWLALSTSIALGLGLYLSAGDPSHLYDPLSIIDDIFLLPQSDYIMIVSWTLTIEFFFYILFAIFFKPRISLFFCTLGFWSLTSIIISFIYPERGMLEFIFHPAVPALAFGAVIAFGFGNLSTKSAVMCCFAGTAGLLSNIAFDFSSDAPAYRAITAGIPSAFLVCGVINLNFRFSAFHDQLGNASYALYLFHIPVYLVSGFAIEKILNFNPYHSDITMFFMLISALFISLLVHHLYDAPIQKFAKLSMGKITSL